jgi:hypothetical protein
VIGKARTQVRVPYLKMKESKYDNVNKRKTKASHVFEQFLYSKVQTVQRIIKPKTEKMTKHKGQ